MAVATPPKQSALDSIKDVLKNRVARVLRVKFQEPAGINEFPEFNIADDGSVDGVFRSGNRYFQFIVAPEGIGYKEVSRRADSLRLDAPKGGKGRTKAKCTVGVSCGKTCISPDDTCGFRPGEIPAQEVEAIRQIASVVKRQEAITEPENVTIRQLKRQASDLNIFRYSNMPKEELQQAISLAKSDPARQERIRRTLERQRTERKVFESFTPTSLVSLWKNIEKASKMLGTSPEKAGLVMAAVIGGGLLQGWEKTKGAYKSRLEASANLALTRAQGVRIEAVTKPNIMFAVGGQKAAGSSGERIRDLVESATDKTRGETWFSRANHIIPINTGINVPAPNISKNKSDGTPNPLYWAGVAKNRFGSYLENLRRNSSEEAVQIASQLYAYGERFPRKPINILAHSAGGNVVRESVEILHRMRGGKTPPDGIISRLNIVHLGTPYFGFTDDKFWSRVKERTIVSPKDILGNLLPKRSSQWINTVTGGDPDNYLKNFEVRESLREAFGYYSSSLLGRQQSNQNWQDLSAAVGGSLTAINPALGGAWRAVEKTGDIYRRNKVAGTIAAVGLVTTAGYAASRRQKANYEKNLKNSAFAAENLARQTTVPNVPNRNITFTVGGNGVSSETIRDSMINSSGVKNATDQKFLKSENHYVPFPRNQEVSAEANQIPTGTAERMGYELKQFFGKTTRGLGEGQPSPEAIQLASQLLAYGQTEFKRSGDNKKLPINIIAHGDGGIVARQALDIIAQTQGGSEVVDRSQLVTTGTPYFGLTNEKYSRDAAGRDKRLIPETNLMGAGDRWSWLPFKVSGGRSSTVPGVASESYQDYYSSPEIMNRVLRAMKTPKRTRSIPRGSSAPVAVPKSSSASVTNQPTTTPATIAPFVPIPTGTTVTTPATAPNYATLPHLFRSPTSTTTKPATTASSPAPGVVYTLPLGLQGAKPRYGYGSNLFTLAFQNDVDKAVYIASSKNKSKKLNSYIDWLVNVVGLDPQKIDKGGIKVKNEIKRRASSAQPGQLSVPSVFDPVRRYDASSRHDAAPKCTPGNKPCGEVCIPVKYRCNAEKTAALNTVGKAAIIGAGLFVAAKTISSLRSRPETVSVQEQPLSVIAAPRSSPLRNRLMVAGGVAAGVTAGATISSLVSENRVKGRIQAATIQQEKVFKERLTPLEQQLAQNANDLKSMSDQVKHQQEVVKSLEADRNTVTSSLEKARAKSLKQEGEIAALTQRLQETDRSSADLAKMISDREKQIAGLESDREKDRLTNATLAEQLVKAESDTREAKSTLDVLKNRLNAQQANNQELTDRIAKLTAAQEKFERETFERITKEREDINKAAREQIRKAALPVPASRGALARSEKGIHLAASIEQGLDFPGGNNPETVKIWDRVQYGINRTIADYHQEALNEQLKDFRDKTKQIGSTGKDRWKQLEDTLLIQNRRELALDDEIAKIRDDVVADHKVAWARLLSQSATEFSPEMAETFDRESANIHQEMARRIKTAKKRVVEDIRFDAKCTPGNKPCGEICIPEENQCTSGQEKPTGGKGLKLPSAKESFTFLQNLAATGAGISAVAAIGSQLLRTQQSQSANSSFSLPTSADLKKARSVLIEKVGSEAGKTAIATSFGIAAGLMAQKASGKYGGLDKTQSGFLGAGLGATVAMQVMKVGGKSMDAGSARMATRLGAAMAVGGAYIAIQRQQRKNAPPIEIDPEMTGDYTEGNSRKSIFDVFEQLSTIAANKKRAQQAKKTGAPVEEDNLFDVLATGSAYAAQIRRGQRKRRVVREKEKVARIREQVKQEIQQEQAKPTKPVTRKELIVNFHDKLVESIRGKKFMNQLKEKRQKRDSLRHDKACGNSYIPDGHKCNAGPGGGAASTSSTSGSSSSGSGSPSKGVASATRAAFALGTTAVGVAAATAVASSILGAKQSPEGKTTLQSLMPTPEAFKQDKEKLISKVGKEVYRQAVGTAYGIVIRDMIRYAASDRSVGASPVSNRNIGAVLAGGIGARIGMSSVEKRFVKKYGTAMEPGAARTAVKLGTHLAVGITVAYGKKYAQHLKNKPKQNPIVSAFTLSPEMDGTYKENKNQKDLFTGKL